MENLRKYCKENLSALCKAMLENPGRPEDSAVWFMAMAHAPIAVREAVPPARLVEDVVKEMAMAAMAASSPAAPLELVDYAPVYTIASIDAKGHEKTLFGPFLDAEPLYGVIGKRGWTIYSHAPRLNDCLKASAVATWRPGGSRWFDQGV